MKPRLISSLLALTAVALGLGTAASSYAKRQSEEDPYNLIGSPLVKETIQLRDVREFQDGSLAILNDIIARGGLSAKDGWIVKQTVLRDFFTEVALRIPNGQARLQGMSVKQAAVLRYLIKDRINAILTDPASEGLSVGPHLLSGRIAPPDGDLDRRSERILLQRAALSLRNDAALFLRRAGEVR